MGFNGAIESRWIGGGVTHGEVGNTLTMESRKNQEIMWNREISCTRISRGRLCGLGKVGKLEGVLTQLVMFK